MEERVRELEERLARLEKSKLRIRAISGLLLAVLGATFLMGNTPIVDPRLVSTQWLRIVDESGVAQIELAHDEKTGPYLRMGRKGETPSIQMRILDNERPYFELQGAEGDRTIRLEMAENGNVVITGRNAGRSASINAGGEAAVFGLHAGGGTVFLDADMTEGARIRASHFRSSVELRAPVNGDPGMVLDRGNAKITTFPASDQE